MSRLFKSIFLIFSLLFFCTICALAEEITITTYYPSPYGSYNELTTSGNTYLATTSGKVGIGTTAPGTYKIYINGTGYLQAAAWVYSSDRRLKENISYIQSGLSIIEQLKPVKFDYIKGDKRQTGFIAQEVEEILPDVITKGEDGMLGMKTESIIPYLVKAIQEQQEEINTLKVKLSTQK
ncbi:MAG: tail fiber domain-containing protein [Candidatus Omnitrophica bacterium]|nr:tail fiber domain-containing protein [Candidatus Omnitrophota bacterium]MBU4303144.1 tail fiber domain-containing protein [Candidatus Omnitrophota bacterium]MBU4467167.1 tail fiber domain-containing protein [Candidatus Omnitrophota bacterium]MCG2708278.1 tail fiber domain-containing protein [Candidatus Omnitrophota bacterium]